MALLSFVCCIYLINLYYSPWEYAIYKGLLLFKWFEILVHFTCEYLKIEIKK